MTFDKSFQNIQAMFNIISDKYDFINNIMSFGTQNYIKFQCIKCLHIRPDDKVIDLCCGTGDLSKIIKQIGPNANTIGIDCSDNMLAIAREKDKKTQYFQGDVTNLPYADNTFDIAVMGFGLRNILNAEKAVDEAYRILKKGGYFMHLDFGNKNFISKIFDILMPVFVKLFTKNSFAYSYLIESKRIFPEPQELIKDFESKGFKFKERKDFLFGVISMQIMMK